MEAQPPAPGPVPTPQHLADMAACLAGRGHGDPASLRGFHDYVLLGHGRVLMAAGDPDRYLLDVPTTQGPRFIGQAGEILVDSPSDGDWQPTTWAHCAQADARASQRRSQSILAETGVGLRFDLAVAPDQLDGPTLVEELWGFSCHPHLGRRILADLLAHGQRAATVMPALLNQLESIAASLAPLGVSVRQCWPMPSRGTREVPEGERDVPEPRRLRRP